MKIHFTFFVLLLLFSFSAFAQGEKEDVIYLKDGTIYRGSIIEEIPNVGYTIRIFGGSRIGVLLTDVKEITKEDKIDVPLKPKPPFHYRDKGFFLLAQADIACAEGFSFTGGYKCGQFGMIGVGFGLNWVPLPLGKPYAYNVAGAYVPVFLYYSGDILRKKTTPFYSIYGGYAFNVFAPFYYEPDGMTSGGTITLQGGPMGGGAFGVKFYRSKDRLNFSLALNVTVQNAIYWTSSYQSYYNGQFGTYSTDYSYSSASVIVCIPTLNFGIGF